MSKVDKEKKCIREIAERILLSNQESIGNLGKHEQ